MENEKKEKIALAVGFILILVVIIITLFQSKMFSSDSSSASPDGKESVSSSESPYQAIAAKELQKKILISMGKEKITLLDIRPFESYAQEHIIDSVNIPPDEFPVGSKMDVRGQTVVIGGDIDNKDAVAAAEKLKEENIKDVLVLTGGMEAWKQSAGSTVTYGDPNSFADQSKVSYVDPEKLNEAIETKVPVYIVDVRQKEDYDKGHITGAINIPFEELEKRRGEISEKKVVVVGMNELQEFQAAVQMYDMLLVSPYVMRGAMPKWQEKGFRVTN